MVQSLPGVQSKVFMAMKCLRKGVFQEWFCDINIANTVYKGVSERLWIIFPIPQITRPQKRLSLCLFSFFVKTEVWKFCGHHVRTLQISERRGKKDLKEVQCHSWTPKSVIMEWYYLWASWCIRYILYSLTVEAWVRAPLFVAKALSPCHKGWM